MAIPGLVRHRLVPLHSRIRGLSVDDYGKPRQCNLRIFTIIFDLTVSAPRVKLEFLKSIKKRVKKLHVESLISKA